MEKWYEIKKGADFQAIAERFGISPVTARLIRNRGVIGDAAIDKYLNGTCRDLYDPHLLYESEKLVCILSEKIRQGRPIRIIGDYDIDGVMSTYILYQGITRCGGSVSCAIPDRMRDGYGINEHLIDAAYEEGMDTIITCDNGISAGQPIQTAKKLGMTVVLTDHHEVPMKDGEELLPSADVIVDPKQSVDNYPYPQLCGAGIAYNLIYELYHRAGKKGCDRELLPFAAMATVCDVVPLYGENRSIVRRGLAGIHQTGNIGLNALIKHLDFHKEIRAMDLGFRIGPCINAPGRLRDATESLELFMETDAECAAQRAARIVETNEERKERTRSMTKQAAEEVQKQPLPLPKPARPSPCTPSPALWSTPSPISRRPR